MARFASLTVAIFVSILLIAIIGIVSIDLISNNDNEYFHFRDGGNIVLCNSWKIHECGLIMKQCSNNLTYYCVHNLAQEDNINVEEFFNGNSS